MQKNPSLSQLVESSRTAIGVRNRSGNATIAAVPTPKALQRQEAQQKRNLQKLYQLLIQPIAQDLSQNETDRIIFIPHGELFLVPFAALVDTNGKYLIENHTILTSLSIQVLDLTIKWHDWAIAIADYCRHTQRHCLLLGGARCPHG